MLWYIFGLFVVFSLALVVIGLSKPTESAQALIGFTFLFLLSFTILGDNIEFKTGELETTQFNYSTSDCSEYGLLTEYVDVSTFAQEIEGGSYAL